MPTYEYQCDACGHQFEEFQYFSEEPLIRCPVCKKKKLRRLFGTGASIIFKGSGFYETDYRSESYKAGAKAETESAKPGDNGAKTDGKPAADSKPSAKPAKSGGKSAAKGKGGTTGTAD
jgi:putative FmdB family regulatory protein